MPRSGSGTGRGGAFGAGGENTGAGGGCGERFSAASGAGDGRGDASGTRFRCASGAGGGAASRYTAAGRPRADRASQFVPFAALTGFDELIRATERAAARAHEEERVAHPELNDPSTDHAGRPGIDPTIAPELNDPPTDRHDPLSAA